MEHEKTYQNLFNAMIEASVYAMKLYLRESNEQIPIYFKLILSNGEIVDIPEEVYGRFSEKTIIASVIKQICEMVKPVAVVQICEIWYVEKTEQNYRENISKYGSVREMPSSIDGFAVMLSYAKGKKSFATTYIAPIVTNNEGNRVLDETRANKSEEIEIAEGSVFRFDPELLTPVS